MADQHDQLLDIDSTAEYLGVGRDLLNAWRTKNIGPNYVKFGPAKNSSVRYRVSDIEAWLDSNTVTTNGGGHNG